MTEVLQFLIRHGYAILFGFVFVEQAGLPVASVPLLLGIGALSADGRFSFAVALLVALAASLPADVVWYEMGRRKGYRVLRLLCRISLEPDTCVQSATCVFRRHGMGTLILAKFIPGMGVVTTPMAGMMGMPPVRFLLLDGTGAALWAGLYLALGVVFRRQLEDVAAVVARTGASLVAVLICAVGGYLGWKWLGRRRYLRKLGMARITPEELWRRMEAGEEITILDLRHASEIESDGAKVPGALRFPPEELEAKHHEIPRDRDIVLYCT
ncbi:MAG TPA: VTT domain-containing protein [Bryobacteraceae bacterium]|nr:VTT domain-containing protein [Bryobacteraceae bacterium]